MVEVSGEVMVEVGVGENFFLFQEPTTFSLLGLCLELPSFLFNPSLPCLSSGKPSLTPQLVLLCRAGRSHLLLRAPRDRRHAGPRCGAYPVALAATLGHTAQA